MCLLSPGQLHYNGQTISDEPTDKTGDFGISGDEFVVPFK
jgi:hypothetical protein